MNWLTDEDIKNSPDYITKSQITRTECNKMGIPKYIPVSEVKETFDEIVPRVVVTGSRFDKNKQRHTRYVNKFELYRKMFKDN